MIKNILEQQKERFMKEKANIKMRTTIPIKEIIAI